MVRVSTCQFGILPLLLTSSYLSSSMIEWCFWRDFRHSTRDFHEDECNGNSPRWAMGVLHDILGPRILVFYCRLVHTAVTRIPRPVTWTRFYYFIPCWGRPNDIASRCSMMLCCAESYTNNRLFWFSNPIIEALAPPLLDWWVWRVLIRYCVVSNSYLEA